MVTWQADFYQLQDTDRGQVGKLLICLDRGGIIHEAECCQPSTGWLTSELEIASQSGLPDRLQVFRPQSLEIFTPAANQMGIAIEATRRTRALKEHLKQRQVEISLDKPPPQPLPTNLWGEKWRFATFAAGELVEFFQGLPLPILRIEPELFPINLGLASHLPIPGLVIYGGRQSLYLARWLEGQSPASIDYIARERGKSGGLVLESGLVERWIVVTFEDSEVAEAAQRYQARKAASKGLHFLLVQPDDSGMTYTGFWLLQDEFIGY